MIFEGIIIGLVLIAAVTAGVIIMRRRAMAILGGDKRTGDSGERNDSRLGFYLKGNQLGFRMSELRALMRLCRRFGIPDPSNMLLSGKTFDRSLRLILVKGSRDGLFDEPETVGLMYRALEYRMGVERNRPRHRTGMETTRTLESGQILKLLLPGVGVFHSLIVENFRSHITIDMPIGKGIPANHKWKDQRLDVYFWRRGDAMYYFETFVLNTPDKAALVPKLHLKHAEQLQRTQKRASIRVVVMKEGRIIPLSESIPADEQWLDDHGYMCKVTDISETGAAVIVRGKVKPGRSVKLQIELGGLQIVLCGDVKSSTLNVTHNVSLLHIEANPPLSIAMRIKVMAYVLGLVTDDAPAEAVEESASPEAEAEAIHSEDVPREAGDGAEELSGEVETPAKPAKPSGGAGQRSTAENIFDQAI